MTNNPKTIAVIGAGVSGLACANRLRELAGQQAIPLDVRVFGTDGRTGGSIRTEMKDGFLLEKGPDSFLSEKPWTLDLCKRLGIVSDVIDTEAEFRRTFIARRGKLHGLPDGFFLIAPRDVTPFLGTRLISPMGKLRMLAEWLIPPSRSTADESVASFVRRRFGSEALERVGQPMLAGVYSGDPEKLGILSTMPRFREMESKHGSVIRALRRRPAGEKARVQASGPRYGLFLSFREGMQTLTDALAGRIGEGSFRLDSRITSLAYSQDKKWTLSFENGEYFQADAVCLAVPSRTASVWLRTAAPDLSALLGGISYESVATLNLAYNAEDIAHPLDGFGFVAPRTEKRSLMACTFVHRKFAGRAPRGKALLRAFVGGAFGRDIFDLSDAELTAAAEQDLQQLLGIRVRPLFSVLTRHRLAMPQYAVGHQELVSRIEKGAHAWPGLFLTGSAYRGTGIPDCVHDAEKQAEAIWESVR